VQENIKWIHGLWILAVIATAAFGQAVGDRTSAPKQQPEQPVARQDDVAVRDRLSELDCRAYAESVIKAVEGHDRAGFNALIDWDSIFNRVLAGWDIPEKARQQVIEALRQVVAQRGVGGQLIRSTERGGQFRFLRVRQSHGRQVVLFRMIQPEEGVSYFEFAPERPPGGQIRAMDIYVYAAGEFMSDGFRRTLLPVVAELAPTLSDRLRPEDKDYLHDLRELRRANQLANEDKPQAALAILKQLLPGTRKQKIVLLQLVRVTQRSDMKEYAAVLEEYSKLYPNDPSLDLLSIDARALQKDYTGAMKAVDRIEQSVGGDPYLNFYRAHLREAQGDLEGAERLTLRVADWGPSLLSVHWALVGYSLKSKEYDKTLERLKAIDHKFDIEFNDLSQVPEYAGFVKSPAYARWLEYLKAKEQDQKQAPTRSKPEEKPTAPGNDRKRSP
jgi:hypothetical protein